MVDYPSTADGPWMFPNFEFWLIPLFITVLLWLLLLLEHLMYLNDTTVVSDEQDAESGGGGGKQERVSGWEIRFQALYVRIVFVFPVFSVLAYIGACFPWLSHWMEFVGVFLEAYVLFGFFAFIVGLGYLKSAPGTFPAYLLESRWTDGPIRFCGSRFKTGEGALSFFFYMVAQFAIVKPTLLLITAILVHKTGNELGQGPKVIMNVISAISIFLATVSVLRVYKALRSHRPNSVMENHNGLIKIAVVKLLFFFIVLDNLILRNLASINKLPIPVTVCDPATVATSLEYQDYCEARTINVIFLIEIVICVIPAAASYRHHGLGLSRSLNCARVPYFLYLVFLRPFDLGMFWNNKLSSAGRVDDAPTASAVAASS